MSNPVCRLVVDFRYQRPERGSFSERSGRSEHFAAII